MKRKRAPDHGETSSETSKVKKQRSQNKNNENSTAEEKVQESEIVLRTSRKRGIKTESPIKDGESSHTGESVKPGTSTSLSNKKRNKRDINQNADKTDNAPTALKRRMRNGLQGKSISENEEPSEPLKKKSIKNEPEIEDNPKIITPTNKKRSVKKTSFAVTPDEDSEEDNSPNESSKEDVGKTTPTVKQGVLKTPNKKKQVQNIFPRDDLTNETEITPKKTKKKVRIDETESLKIKKELAEAEPHFSAKELPAKIIKSKLNKNMTEEVKVSPLTVQNIKKERKGPKKNKLAIKTIKEEDNKDILHEEIKLEDDITHEIKLEYDNTEDSHVENGIDPEASITSEDSDLEVYYINKNAEKEARKKTTKKHLMIMPKEDQLILVQRMQEVIPDGDTKSYKYRLQNLEWQKIVFNDYTLEECQKAWTQLLKKVRHYRLLIEITHDVTKIIEENDIKQTKPAKASRSKKHPDMPKRPLTSYFLYYIRKRDKIVKERPDLDTLELNKYISETYQNLSLEKKQKYEHLAAKNREEYKRQMEEFYAKHPEFRKVIKKEPKERKEKPPKRPEAPYRLFMHSESTREEIAEEDKAEFNEVCREKWRQMSDSKKLVWINLAEDHHRKYEEDLKEYMARHPDYTPKAQQHKSFLSREELNLKDKLAGKPKKPPSTAYGLCISMTMQSSEIVDIPPKERWNYTSTKWKAMTDEEREQYKQLLVQVHDQYKKDFKAYLDSLPEDKRQAEILKNLPKKRKNAATDKPSTSGTKTKAAPTKTLSPRGKNVKPKVQNPTPPPRSAYKYFAEKYNGENAKEAWKNLSSAEKEQYEEKLSVLKEKYIKEFEIYLKSLTKEELAAFCANRSSQEEYSSDESDSDSEHGDEESSDESSDSSESENESDEN